MADLGFQAQVERHFNFLTSEHGYQRTESTPYLVRYESPATTIDLVFDGDRSYELGLLVGKKGMQDPPYSIAEILRLRNAPEVESFGLIQVTTEEALATWVEKLAGVLRARADDFIAGNDQSFAEVARLRRKEVQEYALERELRAARTEADEAWQKKDYAGVIRALEPLRASLTASERAKLKFAEEHRGR